MIPTSPTAFLSNKSLEVHLLLACPFNSGSQGQEPRIFVSLR